MQSSMEVCWFLQGAWIAVKKLRRSKTYREISYGEVAVVKAGKEINQGCNVELTKLSVLEQECYSLGFEAFGQENTLEKMLEQVLEEVLATSDFLYRECQSPEMP